MVHDCADTAPEACAGRLAIGSLDILCLKREAAIGLIRSAISRGLKTDIAICNAHTLVTAFEDPDYAQTLNKMVLLNDGIGADLAARFLHGTRFPENLNGTDLIPALLEEIGLPLRIYLLGAAPAALAEARAAIGERFPDHRIVGSCDGYFSSTESDRICAEISALRPDLLLVAMGNPKQERFIVQNRPFLDATVTIGVGALFDFLSGKAVRAPGWMRIWGLEWLFRLSREPRRLFGRYVIGIPKFFFHIARLKRAQRRRTR
ncbi:WecB/TagA/CpsF family glycosyltransferase [Roseibium aquae]|nr:WecB/TagA/CpsF family glycosyltransferase [Roseibium aquae]